MIVAAWVAAILSFFIKEDLKRLKQQGEAETAGEVKTAEDEMKEGGLIM